MIYLKSSSGQHIVILEPSNIDALKKGGLQRDGTNRVLIAYTPDAEWLGSQILANIEKLDPETLDRLIKESQARAEVKTRPYHPVLHFQSGGQNEDHH